MDSGRTGSPEMLQIQSGQAQLTVARSGQGGSPSVVMLHPGIADHRCWTGVMIALASEMDLLAYDRRGFGTTTYEAEEHDQVVDLLAVLDSIGVQRAVLVGNSMGGEIAVSAALACPERVSALVLVAPAVVGAPAVTEADVTPIEAELWQHLEAAESANALDALNLGDIRLWLDGPTAPEGRIDGDRRALALEMNRIALHAESPGYEPEPPDAWSQLGDLAMPVMVVVGDLDLSHQQRRCHVVAERIHGSVLHVMPGTAHLPAFEQPEAFAALLREFLSGLPD